MFGETSIAYFFPEHAAYLSIVVSNREDHPKGIFTATGVLLGDHDTFAAPPVIQKAGKRIDSDDRKELWTDSYSSLITVFK